jgi:hypothetical protein
MHCRIIRPFENILNRVTFYATYKLNSKEQIFSFFSLLLWHSDGTHFHSTHIGCQVKYGDSFSSFRKGKTFSRPSPLLFVSFLKCFDIYNFSMLDRRLLKTPSVRKRAFKRYLQPVYKIWWQRIWDDTSLYFTASFVQMVTTQRHRSREINMSQILSIYKDIPKATLCYSVLI